MWPCGTLSVTLRTACHSRATPPGRILPSRLVALFLVAGALRPSHAGQRGFQQLRLFCASRLSPQRALGGQRPRLDMPSSARGSALGFWCERSLCTLDKRLSRRRVCSTPFCTHALSVRAQLTPRSEANFLLHTLHMQVLLNVAATVLFIAALLSSAGSKKCTEFTI